MQASRPRDLIWRGINEHGFSRDFWDNRCTSRETSWGSIVSVVLLVLGMHLEVILGSQGICSCVLGLLMSKALSIVLNYWGYSSSILLRDIWSLPEISGGIVLLLCLLIRLRIWGRAPAKIWISWKHMIKLKYCPQVDKKKEIDSLEKQQIDALEKSDVHRMTVIN